MRISILPKSLLGWLSVGLVVAAFVFVFSVEGIISPTGASNFSVALRVTLMFIFAAIAGAAAVIGFISIIKRRQRAILVFVSTAIGLFPLIGGVVSALQL